MCGTEKRCGNIGGVICAQKPVSCALEDIRMTHFRGKIQFVMSKGAVSNLTTTITHFGATRRGINGP